MNNIHQTWNSDFSQSLNNPYDESLVTLIFECVLLTNGNIQPGISRRHWITACSSPATVGSTRRDCTRCRTTRSATRRASTRCRPPTRTSPSQSSGRTLPSCKNQISRQHFWDRVINWNQRNERMYVRQLLPHFILSTGPASGGRGSWGRSGEMQT